MAETVEFQSLTGLSNNSIIAIHQDERGFLWFGTRNGLNLYNGNGITTFKYEKGNSESIPTNGIVDIIGGGAGRLYIITSQSLSRFDMSINRFTTIVPKRVNAISYDKVLFFAIDNKIYTYGIGQGIAPFCSLPEGVSVVTISAEDGRLLVGTEKNGMFIATDSSLVAGPVTKGKIIGIIKAGEKKYWALSERDGIWHIENGQATDYLLPSDRNGMTANEIHCGTIDNDGNLLVGTSSGIDKFEPATGRFSHYTLTDISGKAADYAVYSILCDRQGTIWAGTYLGGVRYLNENNDTYTRYSKKADNGTGGLESYMIGRITGDEDGRIWMCSEDNGLICLDRQSGKFSSYTHESSGLSPGRLSAIFYDSQRNVIWTGGQNPTLDRLDLKTGRLTSCMTSVPKGMGVEIRDIVQYQNILILATSAGIYAFDPDTGTSGLVLGQDKGIDSASNLFIDSEERLWICGTKNGIYTYSLEGMDADIIYMTDAARLKNYRHDPDIGGSISSNSVHNIFEDSGHRLWLCTNDSGIDIYDSRTGTFSNVDMKDNNLGSDSVYGGCELGDGKFLFATDNGFSILDTDTWKFRNYSRQNGFPISTVNEHALYMASDGEIFICGAHEGLVSFYVKNLDTVPETYGIFPFCLTVNGKTIKVNDDSGILSRDLTETSSVTLPYDATMVSIEYAVTNYVSSDYIALEYRLEGFSDDWTPVLDQHVVTYTNLSPGRYTLVVRPAQNITAARESRLGIRIRPPFYGTTFAIVMYFVLSGSLLYWGIRSYKSRIRLHESLKYAKKHTEDIEELNRRKLHFVTNIAHEFRTPLTLILGELEMLLQNEELSRTLYGKLLGIYRHGVQFKGLISEFMDFRKSEQGALKIKASEHNIVDFVHDNFLIWERYALHKGIDFKFIKTADCMNVWYDAVQMQKVMNNLLSNAFKFTKEGGSISLLVHSGNNEVIIEVTDTGTGIPPEDISRIFENFYQSDNSTSSTIKAGTGIGLALTKVIVELHHGTIDVNSRPGEGTTFIVRLKTGSGHFSAEQLVSSPGVADSDISGYLPDTRLEDILNGNESEQQAPEKAGTEEPQFRHSMLVVEDNDSLREMLENVFSPFYTVFSATNGKQGLDIALRKRPDIILSDVVMPEMSGVELCEAVKTNFDICHIPVVLLTARTEEEQIMEGVGSGADLYVTKPFNIKLLISQCNGLVNNRIKLQEKFSERPQAKAGIMSNNAIDAEFLAKVSAIIERHLDNSEFSVDTLAVEMHIARTKLFSKLKVLTGMTPHNFILTIRLKKALVMLEDNPELNISEISDRLGFGTPRLFSKMFKEKYGITPTEYRAGHNI